MNPTIYKTNTVTLNHPEIEQVHTSLDYLKELCYDTIHSNSDPKIVEMAEFELDTLNNLSNQLKKY